MLNWDDYHKEEAAPQRRRSGGMPEPAAGTAEHGSRP